MVYEFTRHEIVTELERLLADSNFSASERNRNFLKYIITEYLEGRADGIKAYTIAVDVFGRSNDFDPHEDSIVRIEAMRLRAAMKDYYLLYPQNIEFRIPKGKYRPEVIQNKKTEIAIKRKYNFTFLLGGSLILIPSLLLFLISIMSSEKVKFSLRPQVSISIDNSDSTISSEHLIIYNSFITELSRFETIRLLNETDILRGNDEIFPFSENVDVIQRKYHLSISISTNTTTTSIHWRVLANNNEILQAGLAEDKNEKALLSRLTNKLAGYAGVIPWAEGMADFKEPTLGNGCIQRITITYAAQLGNEFQKDHKCLLKTLELQPTSADARAILSQLMVSVAPFETSNSNTVEALSLARAAVIIAPESSRSSFALTMALYHNQHLQAAIANGLRTIALNPNEYVLEAYLGWLLYLEGQRERGVELAVKTQGYGHDFSKYDAGSTLILDAYLHEDYQLALHRLDRKVERWPYLANILLIATLGHMDKPDEAETAIARLREMKPEFEMTFHQDMKLRSIGPDIKDPITKGLRKAGLGIAVK